MQILDDLVTILDLIQGLKLILPFLLLITPYRISGKTNNKTKTTKKTHGKITIQRQHSKK
jgi:hypothetical protein